MTTGKISSGPPNSYRSDQVLAEYQGAEDDGFGLPDPISYTAWNSDLAAIGDTRYARFRITFRPGTGNPDVDEIELPFN